MLKMSTGLYVESYFLDMMEDYYYGLFRKSSQQEDLFEGTDFFVGEVPVDVTINSGKNFSKHLDTFVLDGITLNVLKRYGNGSAKFKRPTLVLQIESYDLRDRMLLCELVEENITKELIDEVLKLY